jgi:hypothetical protein
LTGSRERREARTSAGRWRRLCFLDETFWPQFQSLNAELRKHLDEVAKTVIEAAVHRDGAELTEQVPPKQLAMPIG